MQSNDTAPSGQAWPQDGSGERRIRRAPHVLLVDDNLINRRVAGCVCELLGYSYSEAEDGEEAVEAVQRAPFDLILMDIRMPRMDGVEAAGRIRRLGLSSANIPIIAVTADADPSDVARYRAAGMCAVVPKPVRLDRLIAEIQAALSSLGEDVALTPEQPSFAPRPSPRREGAP